MRQIVTLLMALAAVLASAHCLASGKLPSPTVESVEQRVLRVEEEYAAAEVARDESVLRRLVDDRFLFNSSDGSTSGKEDLIRGVMSMDMVGQELSERSITVEGRVAIIFGTTELRFPSDGEDLRLSKYRYMSVYVDRGGEWRMLGLQMQKHSSQ